VTTGASPFLLAALFAMIAASVGLGRLAQKRAQEGEFLKGYFIGNRSLGPWALGLTTMVQSAGTFMGFPALVYSHGWALALWLSGHMVIPLAAFGLLAKRVAHLSRRTGSITVPDLLRERFGDGRVGGVASLLILFFMVFSLIGQFKAGALLVKMAWPGAGFPSGGDAPYYVGLAVFAVSVIGYTVIGGFLAAVWTDLFQSLLMVAGVLLLLVLTLAATGGSVEQGTRQAVESTGPEFAFCPGYSPDGREFVPLSLAFSLSFLWFFGNAVSPGGVSRVMACKDLRTLRRSMVILSVYNALVYVPLLVICVCGRSLLPDLPPRQSDEFIPRLAVATTARVPGGQALAALILMAPLGGAMATVSSYLVVVASGLVRDVYQRWIHPSAPGGRLRILSYVCVLGTGAVAVAANLKPVDYLQAMILFSGAGMGASFFAPLVMALYWRRATAAGALAAMSFGALAVLGLFVAGWAGDDPGIGQATRFRPFYLLGLDPFVWGMAASSAAGVAVSLLTRPPSPARISRMFDAIGVPEESHVRDRTP
jgi:SSS family solute:Na+ symporter/sodium/pantothenate symporter